MSFQKFNELSTNKNPNLWNLFIVKEKQAYARGSTLFHFFSLIGLGERNNVN